MIALIGAGIGVLLGILLAYTIAAFAGWAVGFGVYPAMSAARLAPVTALQSD